METKRMADEVFLLDVWKYSHKSDPNCRKHCCKLLRLKHCHIPPLPPLHPLPPLPRCFLPPYSALFEMKFHKSPFSKPQHATAANTMRYRGNRENNSPPCCPARIMLQEFVVTWRWRMSFRAGLGQSTRLFSCLDEDAEGGSHGFWWHVKPRCLFLWNGACHWLTGGLLPNTLLLFQPGVSLMDVCPRDAAVFQMCLCGPVACCCFLFFSPFFISCHCSSSFPNSSASYANE